MSDKTTKDLHIHLSAEKYANPGTIHLLSSYQDFKELEVFLSANFNTVSYTHDDIGFPERLFKCPKGTMFLRDEHGELVPSEPEP